EVRSPSRTNERSRAVIKQKRWGLQRYRSRLQDGGPCLLFVSRSVLQRLAGVEGEEHRGWRKHWRGTESRYRSYPPPLQPVSRTWQSFLRLVNPCESSK
ncbi:unnamed protein product, partial [Mycena citricolor]